MHQKITFRLIYQTNNGRNINSDRSSSSWRTLVIRRRRETVDITVINTVRRCSPSGALFAETIININLSKIFTNCWFTNKILPSTDRFRTRITQPTVIFVIISGRDKRINAAVSTTRGSWMPAKKKPKKLSFIQSKLAHFEEKISELFTPARKRTAPCYRTNLLTTTIGSSTEC